MRRKSYKKKNSTKLMILVIAVAAIALGASLSMNKKNNGIVVATVNGDNIYKSELEEKVKSMFDGANKEANDITKLPKEVIEIFVKDIYVQHELDKKIKKSKFGNSKEIEAKVEEYAKKLVRQEYLNSLVKASTTEDAVRNKYTELSTELNGKKEFHLRHIMVKNGDDANKVAKLLKGKTSFEDLAKKYSLDAESAKNGGDLGFIIEDNLTEEFSTVVKAAKIGSTTSPIKTANGWHIVKVEEARDAQPMAFESVKSSIEDQLKKETMEKYFSDILKDVKINLLITDSKEASAPEKAAEATSGEASPATTNAETSEVKATEEAATSEKPATTEEVVEPKSEESAEKTEVKEEKSATSEEKDSKPVSEKKSKSNKKNKSKN